MMKDNDKFSISGDMLGIISFLVRRHGPHVGGDGSIWLLREIHEQLPKKRVEPHLVTLAFELLSMLQTETLCAWVDGKVSLTPDFERWLRDSGWLYGEVPQLPKAIKAHCKFLNEYVYNWQPTDSVG